MSTQPDARDARGRMVVIGNFDGVHRGHQAVLMTLARLARERDLTPSLLTFDPHPAVTLGRAAPALLTRLARRIELATRACPDLAVLVRPFSRAFSELSPEAFVAQVLVGELGARAVMVGRNFRFGRDRSGGLGDLDALGQRYGFSLLAEPLVSDEGGPCSSSRIRERIAQGDVEGAARLLGRPHMLQGRVAHGDKRGRTIGFPTCNVSGIAEALPPNGVYAVLVDRVDGSGARVLGTGVANLGVRPTVAGDGGRLLEVHLFDWQADLYGAELRVHLVRRLREERRFASLDELRAQIARDGETARAALAGSTADPDALGAWT